MLSPSINSIDDLPYRQIQIELKKRQLNSSGNKNTVVKRLKVAYETELLSQSTSVTQFHDLPTEIYLDIFDYLNALDVMNSFYGINHRLNTIIESTPIKLKMDHLNKKEYKYTLKHIVPKLVSRTASLEIGCTSLWNLYNSPSRSSEYFSSLFFQSFKLAQFTNLRYLTVYTLTCKQLEMLLLTLPNMPLLCSLRLFDDYSTSSSRLICKVTLADNYYRASDKDSHSKNLTIDTSPPFRILNVLHEHLRNKMTFNSIQLNINCGLFFYWDVLALIDWNELSSLLSNTTYLQAHIMFGPYIALFNLIRYFSKIQHLSVKAIAQAYADGHQWSDFLATMPNLSRLDLQLELDSDNINQELQKFQSKFWLERRWFVQCEENISNSSQYKIVHRSLQNAMHT